MIEFLLLKHSKAYKKLFSDIVVGLKNISSPDKRCLQHLGRSHITKHYNHRYPWLYVDVNVLSYKLVF